MVPDYLSPSRWEAQADAVNLIFSAKTQANPESSVGLMNMAGRGPEMLVTLTTDFGKLLDGIHRTKIRGSTHLATAIQIAGVWLARIQVVLEMLNVFCSLRSNIARTNRNDNALLSSPAPPSTKMKRTSSSWLGK